jgi:RimJ/RimL family protein N-acetyltransferase
MTAERLVPSLARLVPEPQEGDIYRVRLDPVTKDDLEYIRELRNRYRTSFVYQREITPEQQQAWWQKYSARPRDEYTFYVIRQKATDERMGTTSLTKVREGLYEFGNNILDEAYQGKGYFREVYQKALEILGNNTLMATVLPENTHMQDVYRKFRLFETMKEGMVVFSNRPL